MKKTLIALGISVGLAGCGGVTVPERLPTADPNIGGIWFGYNFTDQLGDSQEFIGIATEDGTFRYLELATQVQFVGTVTFNGEIAKGSGVAIAAPGATWGDTSMVSTLDISGFVVERESVEGDWSLASGETGYYWLLFDSVYFKDSSLDLTAGVWSIVDDTGADIGTLTVEADGSLNGQNIAGCLYSGNLAIIDMQYDVYDVSVTISNCAESDGVYTGFGALGDDLEINDSMLLITDDGSHTFAANMTRVPPG
ncbi:MAG: hypothetical protein MUP90_04705 [Gammaproteobacteria bacterium]|nr:hypothetical protein [Gammaproteobacteria bacterium]